MYFGTKSYLKSTRNHTAKHAIKPMLTRLHQYKKKNFKIKNIILITIIYFELTSSIFLDQPYLDLRIIMVKTIK
jgi:hypothetical protein